MKYIIHTVAGLLIYHLFVCSIASFAQWENMLFNFDDLAIPGRFFYSLGFLFVLAFCLTITSENNGGNNDKT